MSISVKKNEFSVLIVTQKNCSMMDHMCKDKREFKMWLIIVYKKTQCTGSAFQTNELQISKVENKNP